MPLIPRCLRKPTLRKVLLIIFCAWILVDVISFHLLLAPVPRADSDNHFGGGRLFIASTHWNNEGVIRSHWNDLILKLAKHFGPENLFVSVYESGSWDNSKGALRELDDQLDVLGVERKIVLDDTTHNDEISKPPAATGWIDTPRGQTELRRIPYLSRLRNLSLEPLLVQRDAGKTYDKVIFLNDVIFSLNDFLTLLETNHGDYAAACALDFAKAPMYYDTFALRDDEGHEPIMQTWPYFRSWRSRKALKANKPVPVRSCWNGVIAMDAAPFYATTTPGSLLQFRGIPDSLAKTHLEASECCLIHHDNPLTPLKGVWLNPLVRVGYNVAAYDAMKGGIAPDSLLSYLMKTWENRLRRWLTTDWFKRRVVQSRLSRWKSEVDTRDEKGVDCLINEMQVLVKNGWAHV